MARPNESVKWKEDDECKGIIDGALSHGDSVLSPSTRKRSMSVSSAQPSVETVVTKAKRAASTLWTLLHAQVGKTLPGFVLFRHFYVAEIPFYFHILALQLSGSLYPPRLQRSETVTLTFQNLSGGH